MDVASEAIRALPDLEPAGRSTGGGLDARLGSLETLVGAAPDAIALMPAERGRQWMTVSEAPRPVQDGADFLLSRAETGGMGFVALFSGAYSGRLLGLKVPSLIAGVMVDGAANALDEVAATLDRLNGAHGLGLIPRAVTVEGVDAMVIDAGRGGVYGSLSDDERAVFAEVDGWLTVCSSMRTLRRLLMERNERERLRGTAEEEPVAAVDWPAGVRRAGGGEYVWVDPGAAGTALKKILAAYSLVLMVQQSNGHAGLRDRLDLLRSRVEPLQSIRAAELWVARDRPEPTLRFRLSTEPNNAADDVN
jgi:hypothetical protein